MYGGWVGYVCRGIKAKKISCPKFSNACVRMYVCVGVYVCVGMYVCVGVYVCVRMYVCVGVYVCGRVYVCRVTYVPGSREAVSMPIPTMSLSDAR